MGTVPIDIPLWGEGVMLARAQRETVTTYIKLNTQIGCESNFALRI